MVNRMGTDPYTTYRCYTPIHASMYTPLCGGVVIHAPPTHRDDIHAPRERKEEEKIMIEFFMAMIPPTVTHQEKNIKVINGKPIVYEPEELKSARRKLIGHLAEHVPERKSNKPLRLIVKWCYPLRQQKRDGQYKDTKPDLDNAQKLLQDCMTYVGFWKDDAQIASLVCEKFWSKIPGIYIRIEELSSKIKTCGMGGLR